MKYVEGLPKLEIVFLNNTKISDIGLEHLKGLSHLRTLFVCGTKVTAAGAQKIEQSIPYCDVRRTKSQSEVANAPQIDESDDAQHYDLDPATIDGK